MQFEFAAEHCRAASGVDPEWWPDLQEQFSSVARTSGALASLDMMESVADIIVQEGAHQKGYAAAALNEDSGFIFSDTGYGYGHGHHGGHHDGAIAA